MKAQKRKIEQTIKNQLGLTIVINPTPSLMPNLQTDQAKDGTNALDIATKRDKSKPTIERYLRIAKEVGIVEFKGAPKTGGYYLTKKMQATIK